MKTEVIRIPNMAKQADEAIKRHEALPWKTAPFGFMNHCPNAVPEIRQGGATLSSIRCPECGFETGVWSLELHRLNDLWEAHMRERMCPRQTKGGSLQYQGVPDDYEVATLRYRDVSLVTAIKMDELNLWAVQLIGRDAFPEQLVPLTRPSAKTKALGWDWAQPDYPMNRLLHIWASSYKQEQRIKEWLRKEVRSNG